LSVVARVAVGQADHQYVMPGRAVKRREAASVVVSVIWMSADDQQP
jgi:hypothetical protein